MKASVAASVTIPSAGATKYVPFGAPCISMTEIKYGSRIMEFLML
jgi:hypothetical protein